jgi:DHA1 family bicyclomycin/chloramphenicol resistance-like MFS transporter
MLSLRSPITMGLLVSFLALNALSSDVYLPALPTIAANFDADVAAVQLTLSTFLFGFALSHLIYGPLSDRFGRKPVLILGLGLYIFSSIGCALSDSLQMLVIFRFLQACGCSAGTVIPRAMVRDIYGPIEAGRVFAYMGSVMALAPAFGPLIGGHLTVWFGWEAVFWFLSLFCFVAMLSFVARVPESFPEKNPDALHLNDLIRNHWQLIFDRRFLGYTACLGFLFTGLFGFISIAPYLLIELFGIPPERFGYYWLIMVVGFVIGSLLSARLHVSFSVLTLLRTGALVLAIAGYSMLALVNAGVHSPWAIVGPQAVYMLGLGIVVPQATAGVMASYPRIAGTASAFAGFLQMSFASLAGLLIATLHDGTPAVMATASATAGLSTLLIVILMRPVRNESAAAAN